MNAQSALVILDNPETHHLALERAWQLSQQTGIRLDCVAFAEPETKAVSTVGARRGTGCMPDDRLQQKTQPLRDTVADICDEDTAARMHSVWGYEIARWVENHVDASEYDLVIKTAHRSKRLLHTPLDWDLLRTCPTPLLFVSDNQLSSAATVLATVDLRHTDAKHEELNKRVLAEATVAAELNGGELHIVAVTELLRLVHDLEIVDERALEAKKRKQTKARLDALTKPYDIPSSNVHMPVGTLAGVVKLVAKKLSADLVVVGMSTHRHGWGLHVSSPAERILQRVSCDVLAVGS